MIYRAGIIIEELIDENDTIQDQTEYRNLESFDSWAAANEFIDKLLAKKIKSLLPQLAGTA